MQIIQFFIQKIVLFTITLIVWMHILYTGSTVQTALSPSPLSVATTTIITNIATSSIPLSKNPIPVHKTSTVTRSTTIPSISETLSPPPSLPAPATTGQNLAVNTETRSALVNILCTTIAGGYLHPISGSGVLIDPRGVILTNAHVGQFFLLKNYIVPNNVNCTVRTGSPAQATYTATLLYLPPAWIKANAAQIVSSEPTGTGENDYAFLLITGTVDGSVLPNSFPYVPYTLDVPIPNTPVLLAGYPAGFLEASTIEANLYAASALSTVQTLYSFTGNTVDAISVGSSIVAQSGSSGGAVVRTQDGQLLGIIATETIASTTAGRDLRAITTGHIDRSLTASGLGGINTLLSEDLPTLAGTFNAEVAPVEEQELVQVLRQHQ